MLLEKFPPESTAVVWDYWRLGLWRLKLLASGTTGVWDYWHLDYWRLGTLPSEMIPLVEYCIFCSKTDVHRRRVSIQSYGA